MTLVNPLSLALKSWEARAKLETCQFLSVYFLSSDLKSNIPQEPPGWLFKLRKQQSVSRVDHCLGRCPVCPSSAEVKGTELPSFLPAGHLAK